MPLKLHQRALLRNKRLWGYMGGRFQLRERSASCCNGQHRQPQNYLIKPLEQIDNLLRYAKHSTFLKSCGKVMMS